MSTNATVGILDKDGNVTYNVVWHDGYMSHLGVILYKYFNSKKEVELITMLDSSINAIECNSDESQKVGISYIKHLQGMIESKNDETIFIPATKDIFLEYKLRECNYIWKEENKKWYTINQFTKECVELENELINEDLVEDENTMVEGCKEFLEDIESYLRICKARDIRWEKDKEHFGFEMFESDIYGIENEFDKFSLLMLAGKYGLAVDALEWMIYENPNFDMTVSLDKDSEEVVMDSWRTFYEWEKSNF